MVKIAVKCPVCGGTDISKNGKIENDIQRYICNAKECAGKSFMIEYSYNGCKPGIEKQIIDMTSNACGIRDISRNLKISTDKVMSTLKKEKIVSPVNVGYLNNHANRKRIIVEIIPYCHVEEAELDEMWSYVQKKKNQRWLWLAIDHNTRKIVAFAIGRRVQTVFAKLRKLLKPFDIRRYYTDALATYSKLLPKKVAYCRQV